MNLIIKLAWRNIWRNKRRSLLTLAAISFAAFASIAMRGIQYGTYKLNIENAVNLFSGYIQVQQPEYQENPTLNKSIGNVQLLERKLSSIALVKGYSPRIYADGLISFNENSFGVAIFGISPSKEKTVTQITNKIKEGRFFSSDTENVIVVGYKLLENLKANIGESVVLLAQGADGSMGNLKFKIIGTIKTGSLDFDVMGVFIGLNKADELLAMCGKVNVIAVKLKSLDYLNEAKDEINNKLAGTNLKVLSWDEIMPELNESIEFDNIGGILYLAILVIIVVFGILNTILMSITERFKEFGITLAIGMPQNKIVLLVFIETVFIAVIGLIAGNIIGFGINLYIIHNPIEFSGTAVQLYEQYGFLPKMESSLLPLIFINTSIIIFIAAIISSLYPLYKVYKLEPLKGIRYT
ncbi:MAG: FtsX-like permease family protein [bacterium]